MTGAIVAGVMASFIGIMFLYAGTLKLMTLRSFREGVRSVPLVPAAVAPALALLLPILELIAGIGVLLGMQLAKVLILCLLGLFALVSLIASGREEKVSCNCFGIEAAEFLSIETALRNVILAGIVVIVLRVPAQHTAVLTEAYGMVTFALFLAINKAVRNHQEFSKLDIARSS